MNAGWLIASAAFSVGVFVAAVVTLAILDFRRKGIDLRGVFDSRRFATFLSASAFWSLAGLLYIVQASGLNITDLGGSHVIVVVTGWAATSGLWLLGHRFFSIRP